MTILKHRKKMAISFEIILDIMIGLFIMTVRFNYKKMANKLIDILKAEASLGH